MNKSVFLQETDFRRKHVRSYMLLQRSFHNRILGFQQQTMSLGDEKKKRTLSQLHWPIAFVPHEHVTLLDDWAVDVLWVVKSTGIEVMIAIFLEREMIEGKLYVEEGQRERRNPLFYIRFEKRMINQTTNHISSNVIPISYTSFLVVTISLNKSSPSFRSIPPVDRIRENGDLSAFLRY